MRTSNLVTLALVLVAAIIGIGIAGFDSRTAPSHVQMIYVRNLSTYVSDRAVRVALPAIQDATSKDFAPVWHVDARLVFIGRGTAPTGASVITLVDKGDIKGALAYHEVVDGVPDSIIYTGTAKYYGYSWTVGMTHELWEQLVDPSITRTQQNPIPGSTFPAGAIWANEVADPVESDKDAYTRIGTDGKPVLISDFITDKWFGAQMAGPFDFANHVQTPLQIDKGGYAQYWDGVTWNIVSNFRNARDRGFLLGEQGRQS